MVSDTTDPSPAPEPSAFQTAVPLLARWHCQRELLSRDPRVVAAVGEELREDAIAELDRRQRLAYDELLAGDLDEALGGEAALGRGACELLSELDPARSWSWGEAGPAPTARVQPQAKAQVKAAAPAPVKVAAPAPVEAPTVRVTAKPQPVLKARLVGAARPQPQPYYNELDALLVTSDEVRRERRPGPFDAIADEWARLGWGLFLGALLLVGGAIPLAWQLFNTESALLKVGAFGTLTAILLGFAEVCKHKLEARLTQRAVLAIALMLIPLNVLVGELLDLAGPLLLLFAVAFGAAAAYAAYEIRKEALWPGIGVGVMGALLLGIDGGASPSLLLLVGAGVTALFASLGAWRALRAEGGSALGMALVLAAQGFAFFVFALRLLSVAKLGAMPYALSCGLLAAPLIIFGGALRYGQGRGGEQASLGGMVLRAGEGLALLGALISLGAPWGMVALAGAVLALRAPGLWEALAGGESAPWRSWADAFTAAFVTLGALVMLAPKDAGVACLALLVLSAAALLSRSRVSCAAGALAVTALHLRAAGWLFEPPPQAAEKVLGWANVMGIAALLSTLAGLLGRSLGERGEPQASTFSGAALVQALLAALAVGIAGAVTLVEREHPGGMYVLGGLAVSAGAAALLLAEALRRELEALVYLGLAAALAGLGFVAAARPDWPLVGALAEHWPLALVLGGGGLLGLSAALPEGSVIGRGLGRSGLALPALALVCGPACGDASEYGAAMLVAAALAAGDGLLRKRSWETALAPCLAGFALAVFAEPPMPRYVYLYLAPLAAWPLLLGIALRSEREKVAVALRAVGVAAILGSLGLSVLSHPSDRLMESFLLAAASVIAVVVGLERKERGIAAAGTAALGLDILLNIVQVAQDNVWVWWVALTGLGLAVIAGVSLRESKAGRSGDGGERASKETE